VREDEWKERKIQIHGKKLIKRTVEGELESARE